MQVPQAVIDCSKSAQLTFHGLALLPQQGCTRETCLLRNIGRVGISGPKSGRVYDRNNEDDSEQFGKLFQGFNSALEPVPVLAIDAT